jgi:predicted nucleic acid-binding Zn ribbon protein
MARSPEPIGNILAELMARRGYARVQSAVAHADAWRAAAGELAAEYTRIGGLRSGRLEVIVANSTLVQELAFQKPQLLAALAQLLPHEGIKDLRFRVGVMS